MDSPSRIDTDDISGWPIHNGAWIVKATGDSLMFSYVKNVGSDGVIETIGFRHFGSSGGYLGGSRYFLLPDSSYLMIREEQVPDPILEVWKREFTNG